MVSGAVVVSLVVAEYSVWRGGSTTTVGFSNEYIHIYKAEGLTPGEMHPDDDEFLNVVKVPLEEAVQMTRDGRIFDAKSIVAILMLQEDLRS